jgi:1,4-dihydroxy-2-naphthoate octaprenyltransferase
MERRDPIMTANFWDVDTLRNLLGIIRVHIVVGGALAFSIGTLLGVLNGGVFNSSQVIVGYLVVFCGDLSTHYSNDYYDVDVDQYVQQRKVFAGKGILVENPQLRPISRSISITLLVLSIILAGITVLWYDIPVVFVLITIGANFLGWFYSAPPLRLTARGLGELTIAMVTGMIIPGAGYLIVRGRFDPMFFFFALPFMMYGLILSLSLEAPDLPIDRSVGRRNLAVRSGLRVLFTSIMTLTMAATLIFLIYTRSLGPLRIDLRIIVLLSVIPLAAGLYGGLTILQKSADAYRLGTLNVVSLFVFNLLLNVYFLSLAS